MATHTLSFTCQKCDEENNDVVAYCYDGEKQTSTSPEIPPSIEIEETDCVGCGAPLNITADEFAERLRKDSEY